MPDSVNHTSTIPASSLYKNKKPFSTEIDQNAFMKLMLETLKHQDPLSPMDNNQFLQQTSMMTMVERLTRMQTLMEESNSSLLNLQQYEGLVGKTATYEKVNKNELTGEETREVKTGTIDAVKLHEGKIYFQIGQDLVTRDAINGLESKDSDETPETPSNPMLDATLKYAQMIGYKVTYEDGSAEKTGTVAGISMKNGLVELLLDDNSRLKLNQVIGFESTPPDESAS